MGRIIKKFNKEYECKFPWDDDCGLQYGEKGVVLTKKGDSYTTAFLEAFPNNPDTFIRGEGATVEEAEKNAWEQLQRYRSCKKHEFERRGYENGAGFCKHCGLFKSKAFEPLTKCKICGKPTYYTSDINGNYYCEEHSILMDWDDLFPSQRDFHLMIAQQNIKSYEDLNLLIEKEDKYGYGENGVYLKGIKIIMDKYIESDMNFVFGYGSLFNIYPIRANSDIIAVDKINVDNTELNVIHFYDNKDKINRLMLNDNQEVYEGLKGCIKK